MTPQKGEEGGKIWTPLFSDSLTLTESKHEEKSILAKKILREYISYRTSMLTYAVSGTTTGWPKNGTMFCTP